MKNSTFVLVLAGALFYLWYRSQKRNGGSPASADQSTKRQLSDIGGKF